MPGRVQSGHDSLLLVSLSYFGRSEKASVPAVILKYKVRPDPSNIRTDTRDEFMRGRVAMFLAHRPHVPKLRQITGFQWGVAPLPHAAGKPPCTASGCAGASISAQTKHPREAWELLKFLMSPEGLAPMIESGAAVPPLRSIAESAQFRDDWKYNRLFVDPATRNQVQIVPVMLHSAEIDAVFQRELDSAFFRKQTFEQACDRIKAQVDRLLKEENP